MEDKKILLSVKDLDVKFRVRGRTLTAIRGISLDFYENESVAIVGESGSGKSVFTKTFAGMLDTNGYIDNGSIIFNDEDLADTKVVLDTTGRKMIAHAEAKLNEYAKLEHGAHIHRELLEMESRSAAAPPSARRKRLPPPARSPTGSSARPSSTTSAWPSTPARSMTATRSWARRSPLWSTRSRL